MNLLTRTPWNVCVAISLSSIYSMRILKLGYVRRDQEYAATNSRRCGSNGPPLAGKDQSAPGVGASR
jgi:hypothetical protein